MLCERPAQRVRLCQLPAIQLLEQFVVCLVRQRVHAVPGTLPVSRSVSLNAGVRLAACRAVDGSVRARRQTLEEHALRVCRQRLECERLERTELGNDFEDRHHHSDEEAWLSVGRPVGVLVLRRVIL